ncbi:MAG: hypothetical protein V4772_02380 [Pseudomonadota bacterium]
MASLPVAALMLLMVLTGLAQARDEATVHGKALLRVYDLPVEAVAQYNLEALQSQAPGSTNNNVQTKDWAGEEISAPSAGNPYRMVIKVSGTAIRDGDVGARWQTFWTDVGGSMTIMGQPKAKAGDVIQLEGASMPLSFKADRQLAPTLSLAGANNIRMDRIQVEVWSGVGKTSWVSTFLAWSPLWTGLIFLSLVIWSRRR